MSGGKGKTTEMGFIAEIVNWLFMRKHVTIKAFKEKNDRKRLIRSPLKLVLTDSISGNILLEDDHFINGTDIPLPHFIVNYTVNLKWNNDTQTRELSQDFFETEMNFYFVDWPGIERENAEERENEWEKSKHYPYILQCKFCPNTKTRFVNSPVVKMARKGELPCECCGGKMLLIKDGE